MSVSLLPGIISAAMVSVNAVIAVCTPLTVVFRSVAMLLIATFIVVAAKLHRNCASTSGTSICRAVAAGWAASLVAGIVSWAVPGDLDMLVSFAVWTILSREDWSAACTDGVGCSRR